MSKFVRNYSRTVVLNLSWVLELPGEVKLGSVSQTCRYSWSGVYLGIEIFKFFQRDSNVQPKLRTIAIVPKKKKLPLPGAIVKSFPQVVGFHQ